MKLSHGLALCLLGLAAACSDAVPSTSPPAAQVTAQPGSKVASEDFNSPWPCDINYFSIDGPRFVYPGQHGFTATVRWNPPGPGQTCPLNTNYRWYVVRGSSSTLYPCGNGSACVITINPGDGSFKWRVFFEYYTANEGSSTWQTVGSVLSGDITVDPGPFTATVVGPQYLSPGIPCTWSGSLSAYAGTPPYRYSWAGRLAGSSPSVTGTIYDTGNLFFTVSDSQGRQASVQYPVEIAGGYPTNCSGTGKPVY